MSNYLLAVCSESISGVNNHIRLFGHNDWRELDDKLLTIPVSNFIRGCAFSSNGELLIIVHAGAGTQFMRVFDATSDWSVVSGTPTLPNTGFGCCYSNDESLFAVAHAVEKRISVFNTSDWTGIDDLPTLPNTAYGVAFSPNDEYLAIAHANGNRLTILDTSDWSIIPGTPSLPWTAEDVHFSPNGDYLAVAHSNGRNFSVINTSDWTVNTSVPTMSGSSFGCHFSSDGSYLAVAHANSPNLTILNTSDWSTFHGMPTISSGAGNKCRFSPDDKYLAVTRLSNPRLRIIDTSDWSVVAEPVMPTGCTGVAFTDNPIVNKISGKIYDKNGDPCERLIYLTTRQAPPRLLYSTQSHPVTGEYDFTLISSDEVSRIVVSEDDSPVLNDIIDRVIPG